MKSFNPLLPPLPVNGGWLFTFSFRNKMASIINTKITAMDATNLCINVFNGHASSSDSTPRIEDWIFTIKQIGLPIIRENPEAGTYALLREGLSCEPAVSPVSQ